jgi:uncharacterized OsmC-like protein
MKELDNPDSTRRVSMSRLRKARFVARNDRGGELEFGEGDDAAFTPVELLLAAIAGCNAIDVDYITAKRHEAERFDVEVSGVKVRDGQGNRLVDLVLRFDVDFPESDGGAAAREVLPGAVRRSLDRLCTVGRTVVVGTPVTAEVAGSTMTTTPPGSAE